MLFLLIFAAASAFFGPRAWAAWKTDRRVRKAKSGVAEASDATILYTRMLKLLGKRGFQKPGWLTPAEFARMLPDTETAVLIEDFTQAYNDLRFGGDQTVAPRMTFLLDELERPRDRRHQGRAPVH